MSSTFFIEVVSGQRKTWDARILRALLALLEPFYAGVVFVRNRAFDIGVKRIFQSEVPVISIGNLTTGGTGKTPTVAWLVNWLHTTGHRPAILSRGYRSLDGEENDEKRLLDQLCRGIPHVQNRDRVAGSRQLREKTDCNVIVLDDGLQHRRMGRLLDVILIDALNPWGFEHLLPRGMLREPMRALQRAQAILLTRCDQVSLSQLEQIRARVGEFTNAPVWTTRFAPVGLVNASGKRVPFEAVNGQRTCSFAGIGNPAGFRRTLLGVGLAVSDQQFWAFPDHHHYTPDDLRKIESWAVGQRAESLIVTRKDLVKLQCDAIGQYPVWAVDIELDFLEDSRELETLIANALETYRQ